MNFEMKPTMVRGTRRAALGATMAIAAAGVLVAPPAFAAPGVTVTPSAPQSGTAFTANATGLTAGTSYRIVLSSNSNTTDTTNTADAGECLTTAKASTGTGETATLSCSLTENNAGTYYAKVLSADGTSVVAVSGAVNVSGTTAALTAPTGVPGAGTNDAVTITKQDGVIWKVDGTEVTFASGAMTATVPVTDGSAVVTATAAPGYSLPTDAQTSWSFKFSTTNDTLTSTPVPATAPTYNDAAGATQDTVTVTKTTGVDWYVNGTKVTFNGAETTATVYSTQGKNTTVEARSADGYVFPNSIGSVFYSTTLTGEYVEPALTRLAGENRMDTAVAISKKYWETAGTVYVANGLRYADALTAGPAAAKDGGPLLLVMQDSVPSNVLDELKRLKPSRIHIVGGTSVVSAGVEATLNGVAPVTRLSGGTRYATAAAVASKWADGSAPVTYLALGENFPDALSGGSGAANENGALLLSQKTTLSQPTVDALKRLKPTKVVLVGGTDVLADAVALEVKDAIGVTAERYAGADRYATSAAVATASGSATADPEKTLFLATGLNFPDALAGVPAADKIGAPLFLSQPTCLPPSVKSVVDKMKGLESQVRLGSEGVLGSFSLTKTCAS